MSDHLKGKGTPCQWTHVRQAPFQSDNGTNEPLEQDLPQVLLLDPDFDLLPKVTFGDRKAHLQVNLGQVNLLQEQEEAKFRLRRDVEWMLVRAIKSRVLEREGERRRRREEESTLEINEGVELAKEVEDVLEGVFVGFWWRGKKKLRNEAF